MSIPTGYNTRSEISAAAMGTNDYGYTYDPIGNRLESSVGTNLTQYLANELNQYLSVTSALSEANLSYDLDGNLTNDGRFAYTWDGENRLLAAIPLTPVEGSKMLENKYDYKSRRISKTVSVYTSGAWTPDTTNLFTYDGWNLIAETGPTTNYYIWGLDLSGSLQGAGGVGGLLATVKDGQAYFICYDANGNVSDVVSADGTVAAHYEYDPYGNTTKATGPEDDNFAFRFATKYLDTEIGFYYYGYRFFDPGMGRWLSRDPLGERGGVNLTAFVGGDPVNQIDVLGEWISKVEVLTSGKAHYPDERYQRGSGDRAFWNIAAGELGGKAEKLERKEALMPDDNAWSNGKRMRLQKLGKGIVAGFKFEYQTTRTCHQRANNADFRGEEFYGEDAESYFNYRFRQWVIGGNTSGFFYRKKGAAEWIPHEDGLELFEKRYPKGLPGSDGPRLNDAHEWSGSGIPEGKKAGDEVVSWAGDIARWQIEKPDQEYEYMIRVMWGFRAEDSENAWEGAHQVVLQFDGNGNVISSSSRIVNEPRTVPKRGGITCGWWKKFK